MSFLYEKELEMDMIEVEDLCMAWMNYNFWITGFWIMGASHWMPTFYSEIPF